MQRKVVKSKRVHVRKCYYLGCEVEFLRISSRGRGSATAPQCHIFYPCPVLPTKRHGEIPDRVELVMNPLILLHSSILRPA